jgi:hypothetical protein
MRMSVLVMLLYACASNQPRPDDQSAEAHRAEAARERSEADAHRGSYDPAQQKDVTGHSRGPGGDVAFASYNPTDWHLRESDKLSAHARAHEAAAAQLEKFEAEECREFLPKVRAACPVAGPIAKIEDIATGVRFVLSDGAPTDAVLAHMRCHFAWARTRGFEKLPGCPIYIKGIAIKASSDGRSIEVTAGDKATIGDLQRRSHAEG